MTKAQFMLSVAGSRHLPYCDAQRPLCQALGDGGGALRLFAADHTPSSITAVPLPEGSAKRIDEAVQGRVCACSTFDVHVLHDILGELDAA